MNETVKTSRLAPVKNFWVRNERKILVTTTVVSVTASVLMRSGIAKHNEFLKEQGLYDTFYAVNEDL